MQPWQQCGRCTLLRGRKIVKWDCALSSLPGASPSTGTHRVVIAKWQLTPSPSQRRSLMAFGTTEHPVPVALGGSHWDHSVYLKFQEASQNQHSLQGYVDLEPGYMANPSWASRKGKGLLMWPRVFWGGSGGSCFRE